MPVLAIFYVYCCESPVKLTHQVGRFYHMSFQNCHIAAIGEKNRQVCPPQSVEKIACDFRWRSNSPRSAYKIARCVAGFKILKILLLTTVFLAVENQTVRSTRLDDLFSPQIGTSSADNWGTCINKVFGK